MTDNDYNTVQPIEGLPNVLGIMPTEQQPQEQRRKAAQKDRRKRPQPASENQAKRKLRKRDKKVII